jgi:hypothetical protein
VRKRRDEKKSKREKEQPPRCHRRRFSASSSLSLVGIRIHPPHPHPVLASSPSSVLRTEGTVQDTLSFALGQRRIVSFLDLFSSSFFFHHRFIFFFYFLFFFCFSFLHLPSHALSFSPPPSGAQDVSSLIQGGQAPKLLKHQRHLKFAGFAVGWEVARRRVRSFHRAYE